MKEKFEVIDFIDSCRWDAECANNYGLINYSHVEMSDDLRLLTHWICYITDRQMPFEQIWDIGGFVFSDMLKYYKDHGMGINVLIINNPESFFIRKSDGNYIFKSKSVMPCNNNALLKNNRPIGKPVTFISRFYPSDYLAMLYTLYTLEQFGYDFIEYTIAVIKSITSIPFSCMDLIQGLVYGLYILTYDNIGQPSKEQLNDKIWITKAKERTDAIINLLSDSSNFRKHVNTFFGRGSQYNIKRVWCCLRDYIKSPEYGDIYFKQGLLNRGMNVQTVDMLFSHEAKCYLELPGDVWNNNATFRKCLLLDENISAEENKMPLNRLLRRLFEREAITVGYPEQFDTTFDFVPRMCEKNNCSICPFRAVREENDIWSVCIDNKDKFCTVALVCCGYICRCKGNKCSLKRTLKLKG